MTRSEEITLGSDMGGELDFLRRLWALDHALQIQSIRMSRRLGITGPQRLVLRLVGRFPGVLAGSLARLLHLHPSTVTGIVNRLEKRGLIQRHTDGADRRRQRLLVTPKGAELLLTPGETVESSTRDALSKVSAEDVTASLRVFAALQEELLGVRLPVLKAPGLEVDEPQNL